MKANRKFMKDEEGVSPVIAVILMVAITVVLAATVFVLVSNIGKDVGKTGPQFQMVSGTQTSGSQWIVRVAAVSAKNDFTDYQFVMTLPNLTKITIDAPDSLDFNAGQDCWLGEMGSTSAGSLVAATNAAVANPSTATSRACAAISDATNHNYLFTYKDVSGDDKWSTGDELAITFDGVDLLAVTGDAMPTGEYLFEIRHKTSDTLAGSLTRTA